MLTATAPNASSELFEFRNMLFRAGKVVNATVSSIGSLSGHTAVSNSTTVVLFGGYMRNSLTSGVFTYTISAANPTLGLAPLIMQALGPSKRAYPGLVKPDDTSILMYGGSAGKKGLSDLWRLDLKTQFWELLHDSNAEGVPDSVAHAAFKAWFLDDQTYVIVQVQ
jgi:hypothetical protein